MAARARAQYGRRHEEVCFYRLVFTGSDVSRARILLADDHRVTRETLQRLLEPEFDIVGAVADGAELLGVVEKLAPDVILLDVSMPKLNGMQTARELRRRGCTCGLVFVSVHADAETIEAAMASGGSAYVLKPRAAEDLVGAIHAVRQGRKVSTTRGVSRPPGAERP